MKRAVAGAALFLISTQVCAQTQPPPAPPALIAVVDVQRIVHESNAGKSLDAQYDKQHQLFTDQVADKERELENREEDLKKQRTVLTPDSFNAQRESLETYAAEMQKTIQEQSQANQLAFNDAFAQLVKTVRDIISVVAKEKQVAVVLPQEQTLYTGEGTIDITDTVLGRLEARLPNVNVVLPSTAPKPPASADHP